MTLPQIVTVVLEKVVKSNFVMKRGRRSCRRVSCCHISSSWTESSFIRGIRWRAHNKQIRDFITWRRL